MQVDNALKLKPSQAISTTSSDLEKLLIPGSLDSINKAEGPWMCPVPGPVPGEKNKTEGPWMCPVPGPIPDTETNPPELRPIDFGVDPESNNAINKEREKLYETLAPHLKEGLTEEFINKMDSAIKSNVFSSASGFKNWSCRIMHFNLENIAKNYLKSGSEGVLREVSEIDGNITKIARQASFGQTHPQKPTYPTKPLIQMYKNIDDNNSDLE